MPTVGCRPYQYGANVPQATLVASWLTELYLDQINRALLDEGAGQALATADSAAAGITADDLGKQLQSFLATHLEARTGFSMSEDCCDAPHTMHQSVVPCMLTSVAVPSSWLGRPDL